MHIPDGMFVHGGLINGSTAVASAALGGTALWRCSKELGERRVPLLGVAAAFVFAAQMLNFPVAGGTSGHFLGAAMMAILLGPWSALLMMAVVLGIQCLVFADGGLTALGSNIFNMGVVGGMGAYGLFILLRRVLPRGRASFLTATAVASWASVVAASAACAVELAISGTIPLGVGLPAMVGVHVLIGIGEAIVTVAALSLVLAQRPDLISGWTPAQPTLQGVAA